MSFDYSTDNLISIIHEWGSFPSGQPAFSDSQVIRSLTLEMWGVIVPIIVNLKNGYFYDYEDLTISDGVYDYAVPRAAVLGSVSEIMLYTSADDSYLDLPEVDISQLDIVDRGYYWAGRKIHLLNAGDFTSYVLRVFFDRRPAELVATSACGLITAIDTVASEITVETLPTGWTAGTVIDMIQAAPPFGVLARSQSVSGVVGNVITFASLPGDLAVNDYLAAAGESPIPQIPAEYHLLLAQSTLMKLLESMGDAQAVQLAAVKYKQLMDSIKLISSNRNRGESVDLIPRGTFL